MSSIQKLKVSKEEIKSKLELMDNNSFKKLTTEEYLRRLFTVDLDLKMQEDKNDELRIGNPILRILKESTGTYYFKIVNKANLEKVNDYVKGKRALGNGVAICGKSPKKELTSAYYSITIDLDWVSKNKLKNLLKFIEENNLLVNFITVSGTGLHITFLIEEVKNRKKQAEFLNEIKEKITNFLWKTQDNNGEPLFVEPYIFGTNKKNKIQYQSINQGFAMPGSNFKDAFNMPEEYKVSTYLINEKRISLKDLQENIKQADKQCHYGEILTEDEKRVVQYVKTDDFSKHSDNKHLKNFAKHLISNLIKHGVKLNDNKIIDIGRRRKTTESIAGMFKYVGVSEKRTIEIIESFANDYYVNNDINRLYTNKELKQTVQDVYSNKIKTKWLNLNQIFRKTGVLITRKRDMRKFENHKDYLSSISTQYAEGKYIPNVVNTYNNLLAIKKLAITHPKILTDKKSLSEKLNILDNNNINISKSTLRKYLKIINDDKEFSKYCELAQANNKLISSLTQKEINKINYKQNGNRFILFRYSKWNGNILTSINTKGLLSHFNFDRKNYINTEELFVKNFFMEEMINLLRLIKEEQRVTYQLEEVFNVEYCLEEELKELEKKGLIKEYKTTLQTLEDYKTCIYELSLDLKRKTELWNKYYQTYKKAVDKNRVVADETLIKEFNDLMSKVNKKARGFKKLESKPLFNYGLITKKIKELNKELRTFTYNNVMDIDRTKNIIDNFSTYFSNKETEISLFYTKGLSSKKEKVVFLSSLLISVCKQYDLTNEFRIRNSVEMKRGNYLWEKCLFLNEIRVLLINTVKQIVSYDKKTNYKEYETIDEYIKALLDKKRISIGERTNLLSNLITT